jgi:hypothetical protein
MFDITYSLLSKKVNLENNILILLNNTKAW